jgi:hypothetical protein
VISLRRRRLPADRRPDLGPEERVLAWAGEDVLVVTNYGVWLPGAAGRLGWHEIHKATWSGRQLTLVPAEAVETFPEYSVVVDLPAVTHTLLDPDRVPDQVRTRITRSIAYSSHHELPDGGGLRVVARRVPGVNGLWWTVRYDDGTDPTAGSSAEAFVAYGRDSLG